MMKRHSVLSKMPLVLALSAILALPALAQNTSSSTTDTSPSGSMGTGTDMGTGTTGEPGTLGEGSGSGTTGQIPSSDTSGEAGSAGTGTSTGTPGEAGATGDDYSTGANTSPVEESGSGVTEPGQPGMEGDTGTGTESEMSTQEQPGELGTKESGAQEAGKTSKNDIFSEVRTRDDFNTFEKALEQAGMAETLKGSGPYTVFAPSDEAFQKMPKEELNSLMSDKQRLKSFLNAHVVSGKMTSDKVAKMNQAETLQGNKLQVRKSGNDVKVGDATVTQPDITASNGVIHKIDRVLMPPTTG